jgi:GT2 family glycosyltransferase
MAERALRAEPEPVLLARAAAARGQAALTAGDRPTALRWFDRATRLVPADAHMKLSLAAACIGLDDRRAERLFNEIARRHDRREAWFGVVAARLRLGDPVSAAEIFASVLSRHAPWTGVEELAGELVRATAAVGWCGLNSKGDLTVRPNSPDAVDIRLDGQSVGRAAFRSGWRHARVVSVTAGGRELLGSPIDAWAIRRVEGCVDSLAGGVRGWIWHPADPDAEPELVVDDDRGGGTIRATAGGEPPDDLDTGPMAPARGFRISAAALRGLAGLIHVRGRNGQDLMGSPLDPGAEERATMATATAIASRYPARGIPLPPPAVWPAPLPAEAPRPAKPVGSSRRRPAADVVIPVHGGASVVMACLDSVMATVRPPSRIVVVDDASPEPDLVRALDHLARERRITLLRNPVNRGFPASANAGIMACAGRDVVLLNSDTLVPPDWLERLSDAAHAAPDVGTVTPLSNSASILSYPGPGESPDAPDLAGTIRLDRMARKACGSGTIDIPVGVGFCLYLRRDCLDAVGLLRADLFAQGYGEENDYCLRAHHLGWRNVALPGLFVAHHGGASFGAAGRHLRQRNEARLNRLHPGYAALIQAFLATGALAPARKRLDQERWRTARLRGSRAAILVTHQEGGGVEMRVAAAVERHRTAGRRAIVLRPGRTADDRPAIAVGDGVEGGFPNLVFAIPAELPALQRLLAAEQPEIVEAHHLLGHDPAINDVIARLRATGVRIDVHVHDYAWLCPRVTLVGSGDRYCGEPEVAACEACVADNGSLIGEVIGVARLRERSARLLAGAATLIVPSEDTASRMRRHFPGLRPLVRPHEDDAAIPEPPPPTPRDGRCVVCVVGGIGAQKGYNVLLACARDAARRALPLDFILVGSSIDDARLLATARVFVTGSYERREAVTLIRAQAASLGFLPSIWPETWCLALTDVWQAGLRAAVFDLGAPAERVRRTGRGFVLPSGLPARSINNALVAAVGLSGHEGH